MTRNPLGDLGENLGGLGGLGESLGDYLREQRQSARLSVRELSKLAGVSNPYLSQIERGLKQPSAEILGRLAKGLQVSAESLYVRAGLLAENHPAPDTRAVIKTDPRLTRRQRDTLLSVYDSLVGLDPSAAAPTPAAATSATALPKAAAKRSTTQIPT